MSLLEVTRGDLKEFTLTLVEPDGSPLDLTGLLITFTAKRSRWDADADAVFVKTIGDGIELLDATGGTAEIAFTPDETEGFTTYADLTTLHADVQVQSGPDVRTPWMGKLRVIPDITRTTS